MASIGLLAAGVAHEVNTPLTGISSFTQMLLDGADPEDPRTRLLEKIERQTFRAAKIVNGLLNLSRPAPEGSTERAPVDLNAVITDVLALLEHQFEMHRIKVRRELADEPVVVLGHGAQASAGVPEPVPQRQGRDAEGRMAVGEHANRRTGASSPRWPTRARAFRTST